MLHATRFGVPAGLLLVLGAAACSQDRLVAPEEPTSVLAESGALLADPLVTLLVGSLTDPSAADAVRVALSSVSGEAEASRAAMPNHLARIEALVLQIASADTAGSEPRAESDDLMALAALGLLLEQAGELRNSPALSDRPVDRSGIRRPRN